MKTINSYIHEAFRLRDNTKLQQFDERLDDLVEEHLNYFMCNYERNFHNIKTLNDISLFCEKLLGKDLGSIQDIFDSEIENVQKICKYLYSYVTFLNSKAYTQYIKPFFYECETKTIKHDVIADTKINKIPLYIAKYQSQKYIVLLCLIGNDSASQIIICKK